MSGMAAPSEYFILSALIFGVGLAGVLSRRNLIAVLAGVEIMLAAANINFVVLWRMTPDAGQTGQMFALFSMAVAAAEIAVGLALVIQIYRHFRSSSIEKPHLLKDGEE